MSEWLSPHHIGPAMPGHMWPRWARHFQSYCTWHLPGIPGTGLLLCRLCDAGLLLPAGGLIAPPAPALLGWTHHGLQHAAAGDLAKLSGCQGPAQPERSGPLTAGQ